MKHVLRCGSCGANLKLLLYVEPFSIFPSQVLRPLGAETDLCDHVSVSPKLGVHACPGHMFTCVCLNCHLFKAGLQLEYTTAAHFGPSDPLSFEVLFTVIHGGGFG